MLQDKPARDKRLAHDFHAENFSPTDYRDWFHAIAGFSRGYFCRLRHFARSFSSISRLRPARNDYTITGAPTSLARAAADRADIRCLVGHSGHTISCDGPGLAVIASYALTGALLPEQCCQKLSPPGAALYDFASRRAQTST